MNTKKKKTPRSAQITCRHAPSSVQAATNRQILDQRQRVTPENKQRLWNDMHMPDEIYDCPLPQHKMST